MTRRLDIAAVSAFSEEVRVSTPAILAALDAIEHDPADAAAVQEAFRLIHALKGAASMVGLAALGFILNQAEELVDAAMSAGALFPPELIAGLRATMPRVAEYLDAALGGQPFEAIAHDSLRVYSEIAQRSGEAEAASLAELLALERKELAGHGDRAAAAPPAPPPDPVPAVPGSELDCDIVPTEPLDPELAEVFAQEAQEHLQTIARLTVHLGSTPDDRESLLELRRAVHTIKGAAGVVGYKAASKLAHRMEDLLDAVAEGLAALTPGSAELLTIASDALADLITATPDPAEMRQTLGRLLGQFDALVAAEGSPVPTPLAAPAATDEEPAHQASMPVGAPVADRRRAGRDRRSGDERRAGSQSVRVPFQRLNELVRIVSELVLNRATFDQHYAVLIDQVDELRLSTTRLRRVAQKLETEYEVRALAGKFQPHAESNVTSIGGHGFDALEFDRYTDFHLLTRELAETASDIGTVTTHLGETIGDFDGDLTRLGRLTREVQDKAMEFRMVPLATLAGRLERAVRVTAQECGKAVDLLLEGEDVALDKTLLEEMSDALVHLLRNAVDHGIESLAARASSGKPERGRIIVRAYHEGTDVVLEVEDDGVGLDMERIRRTAVAKGYVTEQDGATLTEDEVAAFVFEPGFSTAAKVSEVSGRGVGLDIVKSKIGRLGGRIRVASRPGAGATVVMRVPMTLAITRVLLVRAGGQTLGLPLGAVVQIVRADAASVAHVGSARVVTVDGRTYPLRDLAETLGLPHGVEGARQPVLIANLGGNRVALAVDQIVQTRDAVVKTLGSHLRRITGVWGATLLGDGTVVLILNPADLASTAEEPRIRRTRTGAAAPADHDDVHSILIVDDSLSMRHVLSSVVKKAGWTPVQARDGVEALELLTASARPPDLVLLDIEMPRMDGYEFLATIRAQQPLAALPVVMLTSRGGDKHREKAFGLGASGYVVKPFQEDALLDTITNLIRGSSRERQAS